MHQALIAGAFSHQYLLHYDFQALGDCTLAYMNRKDAWKAIEKIENNAVLDLAEFISELPVFFNQSKNNLKKIIKTAKLVQLPKGWKYNSNPKSDYLYLILKGEVTYKLNQDKKKQFENEEIDLRAVLRGDKIIQREDRISVQQCAIKQKEMAKIKLTDKKQFNKQKILSASQFFAEESMVRVMHSFLRKFIKKDISYTITAHTRDAEVLIFEIDSLGKMLKTEPNSFKELQKSY